MKLKSLLMTVLAGAAMLIACQPENMGPADIKLNTTTLSFEAGAGTQTVELTASRDWIIPDKSDWIEPSVKQGVASKQPQTISISVGPNDGKDRKGYVVFSIGLARFSLTVTQKGQGGGTIVVDGDGSKESPFNVAQAAEAVKDLSYTDNTNYQKVGPFYVKGIIAAVTENFSADYGNGTFIISDDGSADGSQLTAYRVLYLGNKKWAEGNELVKVGDEVVVYGELMNFKGNTPETVQKGSYLYSLNGSTGGGDTPEPEPGDITGTGTQQDPFNVAGAINAVKDLTWTSNTDYQKTDVLYVKGKISRIASNGTYGESGTYGNASFYISDDGSQSSEFYCYRILYLGNAKYTSGTDIKVGDEVIICGELMNYRGNTPETVSNSCYLYSLNGETGGDDPGPDPDPQPGDITGTGTKDDPFNVAGAINAVKDLTWTSNTDYQKTGVLYVKGKISRIASNGTYGESGTYGNASFYISDDGSQSSEFYCYRILYLGNAKYTSGTDIKVGDEVIICGELMNYRGNTPETVSNSCYLYSLNGETGGDDPGPGPDPQPGQPEGDGTLANPYNAAAAIAAVKDLTWTSNTEYDKTDAVYVKGKISRIANKGTYTEAGDYGNASFYISQDGTQSNEFYCFRVLYLGNIKYTGGTDIKEGDDVIIHGALMNYKGNTPETVANEAYLYSLNGETEGGVTPEPELAPIRVLDLRQTDEGFHASWEAIEGTDYYYWVLLYIDPTSEDADEDGYVFAASGYMDSGTSLDAIAGQFDEDEEAEDAQFWEIDALEDGVTYYFAVMALQYDPDEEAESDILLAMSDTDNMPSFVAGGGEPGPGPGPEPEPGDENKVTFTFDNATGIEITTSGSHYSTTLGDITLDLESGARNQNSQDIRIYKGKVMTISSSAGNISQIVITSKGGDNGANKFGSGAPAGYTATATQGTWTGSSKSVSFTASDAQVRMLSIEVTYATESK